MSVQSRERFAQAVREQPLDLGLACLLIGAEVDPGMRPESSLRKLDKLAASVDASLPPAEALRGALGGFTGDAHDYGDLRSSLLHQVLDRRAGLPILLSVIWLEVARRVGFPAYGVGLPGHFIVCVDGEHLDPFSGGSSVDVSSRPAEHLRPSSPEQILLRILTNIRVWARSSPARAPVALWALDLSVLVPHHPVELRRERAHHLVASGAFREGAEDFGKYADLVAAADEAAAQRARDESRAALARLN
jgi:regulator of sirC expression with transglutaminase-like and TPR domain